MEIINLTPHALTIVADGETILSVPASGQLVRCSEKVEDAGQLDVAGVSIPCVRKQMGDLEGLPAAQAATIYFVSAIAAQKAWEMGRQDVVCGSVAVRDAEGKTIGTAGFSVHPLGLVC